MIYRCPYCGHNLPQPLHDGLSGCLNCNRIFSSNLENQLLSAAWVVRHGNITDVNKLKHVVEISEDAAIFVFSFVSEYGYSHDDFQKAIRNLKISK